MRAKFRICFTRRAVIGQRGQTVEVVGYELPMDPLTIHDRVAIANAERLLYTLTGMDVKIEQVES